MSRDSATLAPVRRFQPFWERIITLGGWIWHVIGWIWSTVIVAGVIVSFLMSYATTGRLTDPRTWVVIRFLGAHPVITSLGVVAAILLSLGAFLANRAQRRLKAHNDRAYRQTIVTLGKGVHHLLEEAQKKSPTPPMRTPDRQPAIRTPDQRVRVFISSTLDELAPERQAAREAIAQLHLTPVFFEAGARPYPPRELYRAYLEQSDVFVGLYWQSYGWVAPSMVISGLEDEYRLSYGKPRLIYVKTPAPERRPGLETLLDRIRTEDVASYKKFDTPAELRELLANDLALLLTDRFTRTDETSVPMKFASLPVPRAPLIDREQERATIKDLLLREDVGLVTVTGPGGVGKTRLAVQVAAEVAAQFTDGVAFVSLAGLRDAELVVPAIGEALRLSAAAGQSVTDSLVQYLEHQRMLLLVVDNFEQVLAAAGQVAQILQLAPGLTVLATSREPLRVRDERVEPILPLALPGPARVPDLDRIGQIPAVALFVERAREARPGFALTAENADAIEEICQRLDGLPLALELAAAVLSVLPPAALLARLEQHLPLPPRGARDLPERQQTMRNTIAWSYDLLGAGEQQLFRRLAVFAGGFSLEAAQALGADVRSPSGQPDDATVLEQLAQLLDKNLVQAQPDAGAQPRFTMLETIREYSQEQLAASGEQAAMQERHARYFLRLAEGANARWSSPEWAWQGMQPLQQDAGNLRAALDWALEHGDSDSALRLCGSLGWYWFTGNQEEGRRRLRHVLDTAPASRTLYRARALIAYGLVQRGFRTDESARAAREALSIYQEVGDACGAATAKQLIVFDLIEHGQVPEAQRLLDEAEAAFRDTGDRWGEAGVWWLRTTVGLHIGDVDLAVKTATMALNRFRELGDMWGVAGVLGDLAETARRRGDYRAAVAMCEESLALARGHGARYVEQEELLRLGNLFTLLGEHDQAAKLHGESLDLANRIGNRVDAASVYDGMGLLARRRGDAALAAQYHRKALAIYRELGRRTSTRVVPGLVQALSLASLGYSQEMLGDLAGAERSHREALVTARERGANLTIALCIDGLAGVAAARGQAERAAKLLGSAAAIRARLGAPLVQPEREDVDRASATARRALGDEAFDHAYGDGQALDLDSVLEQLDA